MRYFFLTAMGMLFSIRILAQQNPPYYSSNDFSSIVEWLNYYRDKTKEIYNQNPGYLVSRYTFRQLAQQDFASIIIGENSFSKIGRYATLNINADESRFYFSPITFIDKKNPLDGPFKAIHSIEFSGEVNDQNIFDFKNKNTLKGGYSYTRVYNRYKFKPASRDTSFHNKMVDVVYTKWQKKYEEAQTDFSEFLELADVLDPANFKTKGKEQVKTAFFNDLYDAEIKYYDDKWTRKRIDWFKLNISPLGWSNFSIVDPTNVSSQNEPIAKSIYAPSARISYNILLSYPSKNQFYMSAWLGASQKHSLSEISTPSQWYQFKVFNDSTVAVTKDDKVYSIKEEELQKKFRPDAGLQFIYLFQVGSEFNMGLDIATSFNGLVTTEGGAFVNRTSFGLLFPFLDKDGENSINVEFFYQLKSFTKIEMSKSSLVGIKFGLPFNKL